MTFAAAVATDTLAATSLVTVGTFLDLPAVRRGVPELVTGAEGLDRPIRWVHAGEVPNMASLLKGGELLLTTGMGIRDDPAEQRRFVRDLAARGVVALGLELGTTFDQMPAALVNEAAAQGFPLIALHREVPFVAITEAVQREIVNRQFALMRRGDEIHRRFSQLMLDGAGVPEILAALAETIANPVLLDKAGHGVLYHAAHRASDGEIIAAFDAASRGLPGAPDQATEPVPAGHSQPWGRLVALALDSPIDAFDRVAIERAVALIALALLRARQEDVLAARERGNFLNELLGGRLDEPEVGLRAETLGFPRNANLLLSVAVLVAPAPTGTVAIENAPPLSYEDASALVWRDVRRALEADGWALLAGTAPFDREMLMILALRDVAQRTHAADHLAQVIRAATERHLRAAPPVIAVGRTASSWPEAREALRESVSALPAAAEVPEQTWHDAATPSLERLLWSLREDAQWRTFAEARLAPLLEHDRRRGGHLMATLAAYCAHGGRKAETARSLHLERQSLYHRLDRIELLLGGVDLSDEDTRLGLHLAVRARPYLDDQPPGTQRPAPDGL